MEERKIDFRLVEHKGEDEGDGLPPRRPSGASRQAHKEEVLKGVPTTVGTYRNW